MAGFDPVFSLPVKGFLQPRMTIGIVGGSFNPPHEGHLEVSLYALRHLGLHQIWWMVSPANPLKDRRDLKPLSERVEAAKRIAGSAPIHVCVLESDQVTAYTSRSMGILRSCYPDVSFIWIMGADNFTFLHLWKNWQFLMETVPIAILDRPGYGDRALSSPAALLYQLDYVAPEEGKTLAFRKPPVWTFLTGPLNPLSSTALRYVNKGKAIQQTGNSNRFSGSIASSLANDNDILLS